MTAAGDSAGKRQDIVVPALGESIQEGVIARWLKQPGDAVAADEPVVELETDKITVELRAPAAGVLVEQRAAQGDTVRIGATVGVIEAGASAATSKTKGRPAPAETPTATERASSARGSEPATTPAQQDTQNVTTPTGKGRKEADTDGATAKSAPAISATPAASSQASARADNPTPEESPALSRPLSPSMRRALREKAAHTSEASRENTALARKEPPARSDSGRTAMAPTAPKQTAAPAPKKTNGAQAEEVIPLSPLRRRIAERLVAAKNDTASLTTFNEIDMSSLIQLRDRSKDDFLKRHGVKLGFMSFFTKACIGALEEYPGINAELRDDAIVYKRHYNIGIAVGSGRGLVVPVIRDADQKSFAELEQDLAALATKAKDNKLTLDDLSGGTFTITNGGVFGSMLSTPLLNPPQTGILGMHNIVKRPVAVDDRVEIRPVMYVALTYDHRVVDGREAVQFLVAVKQLIEMPERLFLEL